MTATFHRMKPVDGRVLRSTATIEEDQHEDDLAPPTIELRAAGLSSGPAVTVFCQANGNACPCGKFGNEILKCKKPFTTERMQEIFDEMRTRIEIEKRDDKANLN